jgi:aminopeptidase
MNPAAFTQKLDKYAELAVRVGLNLQPGQRLLIGSPVFDGLTPLAAAPLVRRIVVHAYQAGARLVDVMWSDQELRRLRAEHAPAETLAEASGWAVNGSLEFIERGDALLMIYANDPDLMQDLDPTAVATLQQTMFKMTEPILEHIGRNSMNWSVVAAPVPGWAAKVFPHLPAGTRDDALWDALFEICRVNVPDPVAGWQEHIRQLTARTRQLNEKQYTALHFRGPGTDLTVGLPDGHIWRSGQLTSRGGIPFTANIPTEEVFTMPHALKTEGTVTATKPLSFGGSLMEEFVLTFEGGKVVTARARKGENALRGIMDTDDGAARLGEVALVPHSSPISRFDRLFYNILIDENASSHIALGRAYKFSLEGGEQLSDEEFARQGGNLSQLHIDFMIGNGEMDVDGVTSSGAAEPLMRRGEWVSEF